jgi:hypothetical protein
MNEPRKPGDEEPGIALPSWVDAAITRSRDKRSADPEGPTDAGPAAELSVAPPSSEPSTPEPPPSVHPDPASPVVVADSPREAKRRAAMPWVALALVFAAAALAIGYILLTKPR